jgi:hypothetical protein
MSVSLLFSTEENKVQILMFMGEERINFMLKIDIIFSDSKCFPVAREALNNP